MRIPHVLFGVINPVVAWVLRSSLHGVMSSSVLLLSFVGRRSGRKRWLPLRYARFGPEFHCFTTDDARWWRNFEEPRAVELVVAGTSRQGVAFASRLSRGESLDALRSFLAAYPSDAVYHGVTMDQGVPSEADLARTPDRSIRVRIR